MHKKDHFICTGLQQGERFILKKKRVCDWFGLKLTLFLPTEILGGIIFHSLPIFALLVGIGRGSAKVKKIIKKLPKQCKEPQCYSVVKSMCLLEVE